MKELSADGSDKAVDWSLKQKWEGNNLAGKSLVIKASDDQPHYVIKYSFTTHDDNAWPDRAPKTWKLEGSNDLNEWQTIDEVNDGKIANERVKTFDFIPSNPEFACKYLRLTLVAMKGTGWSQVNEFHVIAAEAGHVHDWEVTEKKEPHALSPAATYAPARLAERRSSNMTSLQPECISTPRATDTNTIIAACADAPIRIT